ncbi:MAG: hypothetical protein ACK5LE_07515 [Alphaproteobacteria bacterium]
MKYMGLILFFFGFSSFAEICNTPANFIKIDSNLSIQDLTIYENETRVTEKLNDVSLINFWALWCAPCLTELPLLAEVKSMGNQYGVYTIYLGNIPESKNLLFLDTIKDLTAWYIPDTNILSRWHAQGLPLTLVKENNDTLFAHYGVIKQTSLQLSEWLNCLTQQNKVKQ